MNKKKQKNFIHLQVKGGAQAWILRAAQDDGGEAMDKVFLLLFVHKKKSSCFFLRGRSHRCP